MDSSIRSCPNIPLHVKSSNGGISVVRARLGHVSGGCPTVPGVGSIRNIFNIRARGTMEAFRRIFGLRRANVISGSA